MSRAPLRLAVVPAAGESRRMGRPKLLLPYAGTTVIEQVLRAWQASNVSGVVVTVRPGDPALADCCRRAGARVIVPASPPPDMKASILLALDDIRRQMQPAPTDAWLLAPADMPGLNPAVIDAVLAAYDAQPRSIVVPRYRGRRGHPVLFPWALADEVAQLGPDEGVNALLKRYPAVEIDLDDPLLIEDLDTPDDYDRWRGR